jgi:hypothetical protein
MAALTLGLHPSIRFVRSQWNARDIWKANRTEQPETRISLVEAPTISLVWWSPDGIADRSLSEAEAAMLEAIRSGLPLSEALDRSASTAEEQAALLAFFSEALVAGLFVAPKE